MLPPEELRDYLIETFTMHSYSAKDLASMVCTEVIEELQELEDQPGDDTILKRINHWHKVKELIELQNRAK